MERLALARLLKLSGEEVPHEKSVSNWLCVSVDSCYRYRWPAF